MNRVYGSTHSASKCLPFEEPYLSIWQKTFACDTHSILVYVFNNMSLKSKVGL